MKKTVLLLLAALLLFAAAGCDPANNAKPSGTGVEPVRTASAKEGAFYIKGELPDIGAFKSPEKYVYYYGEPKYDFIPSDDYGRLLPFIGAQKEFATDWGMTMNTGNYGLCTEDGRVVVEPVYSYVYLHRTADGRAFYTMTRTQPLSGSDDGEPMYGFEESSYTCVIPEDGSWIIAPSEMANYAYLSSVGDGRVIIAIYFDGNTEYRVFDYNGDVVFSTTDYNFLGSYRSGLSRAERSDGEELYYDEAKYDDDEEYETYTVPKYVYDFIDRDGNVVISGLSGCTDFTSKGVAAARDPEGGGWGFIDTEGEWLTPASFDNISLSESVDGGSKFMGYTMEDSTVYLFDESGTLIAQGVGKKDSWLYGSEKDGWCYSVYDSDDYTTSIFRFSDGEQIVSDETGEPPANYYTSDGIYYAIDGDGVGTVFDVNGKTLAKIDDLCSVYSVSDDRRFFVYSAYTGTLPPEKVSELYGEFYEYSEDEIRTMGVFLYDVGAEKTMDLSEGAQYASFAGRDQRYLIVSRGTDYFMYNEESYSLFDLETGETVLDGLLACSYSDGCFTTADDTYLTTYDEDLNVILKKFRSDF